MENNENRMNELENKVDKLSDMLGELMANMAEKAKEQKEEEPKKTDDKKEESKKEEPKNDGIDESKLTGRQKFAMKVAFKTANCVEEVINHPLKSAAKVLIGGGLAYGAYRKLKGWMSDNDVYLNNGEQPMLPERTNNYDD